MNRKAILVVSAALASMALAGAARAETLLFSFSLPSVPAADFTFEQSSDPTPVDDIPGALTEVLISDGTGALSGISNVTWSSSVESGGLTPGEGEDIYEGPQIYSGSEADPVFSPGVFSSFRISGFSSSPISGGTLTITAIPEPATWALMLTGFAGLGAALRIGGRKLALS